MAVSTLYATDTTCYYQRYDKMTAAQGIFIWGGGGGYSPGIWGTEIPQWGPEAKPR